MLLSVNIMNGAVSSLSSVYPRINEVIMLGDRTFATTDEGLCEIVPRSPRVVEATIETPTYDLYSIGAATRIKYSYLYGRFSSVILLLGDYSYSNPEIADDETRLTLGKGLRSRELSAKFVLYGDIELHSIGFDSFVTHRRR